VKLNLIILQVFKLN